MKRTWSVDELTDQWTLLPDELVLVNQSKTDHNRLGFAILLKYFQVDGKFPNHQPDVPPAVIEHISKQLGIPSAVYTHYDWQGRMVKNHRALVRQFLGVRECTARDGNEVMAWLKEQVLPHNHQFEPLLEAVYQRYRELRIEPPVPKHLERLISSALHTYTEDFCAHIEKRIPPATRVRLDAILSTSEKTAITGVADATDADAAKPGRSVFYELKTSPGAVNAESLLTEIAKLQRIRELDLPEDLFENISPNLLKQYRQRVASEPPREVRRHPAPIRYTLLAIYCWLRQREITDNLVELLIGVIKRIGTRAEKKVDENLLKDFKRVRGKTRLLYTIAEVTVQNPDGIVREVVYPVASEQTLRDLVEEFKAIGTYDQQIQTTMRHSYGSHYRPMLTALMKVLTFRSNNELHQPLIGAIDLIKTYVESHLRYYEETEEIPLDGVVPSSWRDLVLHRTKDGTVRVNRMSYEICVYQSLREKLRCKEIWVFGADRFRNPDEDLPSDFEDQRTTYYEALNQPLNSETFITRLKQEMKNALTMLDQGLPQNLAVKILNRDNRGLISLSPLPPQPDLLYVRRRFLTTDNLRAAIAQVVNAIFRVRSPHIWTEYSVIVRI